eukprot:4938553-Pyramimonas_sp.AAC.1
MQFGEHLDGALALACEGFLAARATGITSCHYATRCNDKAPTAPRSAVICAGVHFARSEMSFGIATRLMASANSL